MYLYRYNKTVKLWLFRDTGSDYYPSPMFIFHGGTFGNNRGQWKLPVSLITIL